MSLEEMLKNKLGKEIAAASDAEIYTALLKITKEKMEGMEHNTGNRKLYYISAEFLIGKLLSNNLINLGLFDEVRDILDKNGHNITAVEEVEPEPSLGNGGLGRLAACFLDSIATLGLSSRPGSNRTACILPATSSSHALPPGCAWEVLRPSPAP